MFVRTLGQGGGNTGTWQPMTLEEGFAVGEEIQKRKAEKRSARHQTQQDDTTVDHEDSCVDID